MLSRFLSVALSVLSSHRGIPLQNSIDQNSDSMSVWNLLREFRIRKVHMAVVLNEYGGTIGIVTLEDVVEEIVGEIFDENDSTEEIHKKTGGVVLLKDGSYDVDANTSMDQLSEEFNFKIPEDHQYETVSGFICESFECIPNKGDKIKVVLETTNADDNQYDDVDSGHQDERKRHQTFELEILEANERKVVSVLFRPIDDSMKMVDGKMEKNDESESYVDVKAYPEHKNVGNGYNSDHADKDNDLSLHDEEICENGYTGIVVVEEHGEDLVNNNKH